MKKVREVKVRTVSYVHDPHATQKWCEIYLDFLINKKRKEKEMNQGVES
ncbi:hypothetical protein ACJ2A9_05995 [Anaerobacillus sp. MEB173]